MAYKQFKTEFKLSEEHRAAARERYAKLKQNKRKLAKHRAYARAYYAANKERIRERTETWNKEHPERLLELARANYERIKDEPKVKRYRRRYYRKNAKRIIATKLAWFAKMAPEERKAYQRECFRRWYEKNGQAFNAARRAKRAARKLTASSVASAVSA